MSLRDIALYTHLASLVFVACGVLFADHLGFNWVRGKKQTLNPTILNRAHWWVGLGLGLMIGSGSVLFWNLRDYLLYQPIFLLKMGFVLALIINSFVIEHFIHVAVEHPFATLTKSQKLPLMLSGAVSTISWVGAVVAACILFGWPVF